MICRAGSGAAFILTRPNCLSEFWSPGDCLTLMAWPRHVSKAWSSWGAECRSICPIALRTAHGLTSSVCILLIKGISLIITVDNGVAGAKSYELAQSLGAGMLVTGALMLQRGWSTPMQSSIRNIAKAVAPKHQLVTAGAQAGNSLAGRVRAPDLVNIGTIADMVGDGGENRNGQIRPFRRKTPGRWVFDSLKIAGIQPDGGRKTVG